mgnify:CR=1 FL=1
MTNSKIRVLVKRPGEPIEGKEIENTLESLQEEVGGFIECVWLGGSIQAIVDEEGKLKGKTANFYFGGDLIVGTAIFLGEEGSEFRSLSDTEVGEVVRFLSEKGRTI